MHVHTHTPNTPSSRQWASSRQIESYEKGQKKRLHTKSRSKLFAVSTHHSWGGGGGGEEKDRKKPSWPPCFLPPQKALAEAKQFFETGELPKGMDEKPPASDEEEEEEVVN